MLKVLTRKENASLLRIMVRPWGPNPKYSFNIYACYIFSKVFENIFEMICIKSSSKIKSKIDFIQKVELITKNNVK